MPKPKTDLVTASDLLDTISAKLDEIAAPVEDAFGIPLTIMERIAALATLQLDRLNALPDDVRIERAAGLWVVHLHIRNATGQYRPRSFAHPDLHVALHVAETALREASQ